MTRGILYGLFLSACAIAAPAQAGFEFMPASKPAPAQQAPVQESDAPMPMIPTEPVTAEPLAAPDTDPVRAQGVSRRTVAYPPPANEPMDTEALLAATSAGVPVMLAPEAPRAAAPSMATERLVINPYPLRGRGNETGMLPAQTVEQAMAAPAQSAMASSMTPIPGGEGAPLTMADRAVYPAQARPAPAPAIAPMPATTPVRQPRVSRAAPAAAPAEQAGDTGYTEAVGFGRDLPLPLALSQIIPPEYSYSFAQGIDPGANVSWQGGKPWNVVLNEMLAPSGMKAVISDNQVMIRSATS